MNDEIIYELKPGLEQCPYTLRSGNQCQLAEGHIGRHTYEPDGEAAEREDGIFPADF